MIIATTKRIISIYLNRGSSFSYIDEESNISYIFPISLAIKINKNECGVPVIIAAVINALKGIVPSTPEP